ncbi:prepilin-type N-terminal cleavage/methylation domain-containing protein [Ureibacillus massiliensis]|uniref:prepilin-type N-terminal cleavage/methylation domain-containing protein n=1 Tax=Ureibacillus massiliensis TaxID=292806 RepID=UPI001B80DA40|nr:prepilin-type N-terminal cleavage/methylation domain-containing protein [Ureibacillus massiliensis]
MIKSKYKEKGFTLIEVLLVLSIVVLIGSIVSHVTFKLSEKSVVDQFIQQVTLDIQRMQTFAMEKEVYTTIVFLDNGTYKGYVQNEYNNPLLEKQFPSNIKLNTNSNLKRIRFNMNGDIVEFGSIVFFTYDGYRQLIVNIEKGRLKIVE